MRLTYRTKKILDCVMVISLIVVVSVVFAVLSRSTFAEGNDSSVAQEVLSAKYVTFYDGEDKLTVKTEARTVADAIERANIVINDGDKVEPGLDTEIMADNFHINIYRARPVVVRDGSVEKYIMTANYDYKDIAADAGLTLYDGDEMEIIPNVSFLESGMSTTYEVTRNGGRTLTIEEEIGFGERTERDVNLASGTSEVRQLGEVGVKRVSYNILYIDNKEVSRELIGEEIIREPVDRVVAIGVKKSIPPEWGSCADWARAAGVSEADLSAALDLIYHESGCRVDAANASGAYGIPQALPGSKMASVGSDWATNPVTQIKWMIGYVNGRYGGWQQALDYWYSHGWY
ncbi:MAG: G5 domain-containing protein [Candidatus Saccharimonadaceae bacterium]|nr:G5 domain-containing protein [Candidatus Saccharimonadaceae bacterium]